MGFEYVGRSLPDLFGERAQLATERAALRMARAGGDAMTRTVVDLTPKRSGRTADSWRTKDIRWHTGAHGLLVYESGTESHYFIARLLEHGVAPHRIPERIRDHTGRVIRTRWLEHPGVKAHHLIAHTAAITEAHLAQIVEPALREWAAAMERG